MTEHRSRSDSESAEALPTIELKHQLELFPSASPELDAEAKKLRDEARDFIVQVVDNKLPSAPELLRILEERFGWLVRHHLVPIIAELRSNHGLPRALRQYFTVTLDDVALDAALTGTDKRPARPSELDILIRKTLSFRGSAAFAEAIEFAAKFREYLPFNNMLVYLQNPQATYFATASHWKHRFRRTIKEDARPLVILVPFGPVWPVFDVEETEGAPLPDKLVNFASAAGSFEPRTLEQTLENCGRYLILVQRKPMPLLSAGFATTRLRDAKYKMRVAVRAELNPASAYAVLCHELAHIYLGHLGGDADRWWPARTHLTHRTVEIEAEAVSYIVCSRLGLVTRSPQYLSTYVRAEKDLEFVSLDLVTKVAGHIERMGREKLYPRKRAEA